MLLTSNGENIEAAAIENNIKNRSKSIKDVKAYIKDDKIAVNIYIVAEDNYEKIIEDYNNEVPRYERVSYFDLHNDSLDTRLKQ